jgi:hypothetical protein
MSLKKIAILKPKHATPKCKAAKPAKKTRRPIKH